MERCLNRMVREALLEKMGFEQRSEGSNKQAIHFMCGEIIPGKVNNYKRVATKCTIKFSRSKEVSVTGVLRMWQSMGHGEPDREKQVGPTNTGPWR